MDKGLKKLLISIVISLILFIILLLFIKTNLISFNLNILTNTEQTKYLNTLMNIKSSFYEYIDIKRTKAKIGLINNLFISYFTSYKDSKELNLMVDTFLNNNPDVIALTLIDKDERIFYTNPKNPDLLNKNINSIVFNEYLKNKFLLDNLLSTTEQYSKVASIIIPYPVYSNNNFAGIALFHIHGSGITKDIKERSMVDINSMIFQLGNNVILFSPYTDILEDKNELARIIYTLSKENKIGYMGPSKEYKNKKGTYFVFYDGSDTESNYKFGLITIKVQTNKFQILLIMIYAVSIVALVIYIILVAFSFSEEQAKEKITFGKPVSYKYQKKEEDEFLKAVSSKELEQNYVMEDKTVLDKSTKQVKKDELKSLIKDISGKSKTETIIKEIPEEIEDFNIELPSLKRDEEKFKENIDKEIKFEEEIELPSLEDVSLEEKAPEITEFEESEEKVETEEEFELPSLDEETLKDLSKEGETESFEEKSPESLEEEIELPSLEEASLEEPKFEEKIPKTTSLTNEEEKEEEIELPSLEDVSLEEKAPEITEFEESEEKVETEEEFELPSLDEETLKDLSKEGEIESFEEKSTEISEEEIELPSLEETKEETTLEEKLPEISEEEIELPSLEEAKEETTFEEKLPESLEEEIELPSLEEASLEEPKFEEKIPKTTSLTNEEEEASIDETQIALSDDELSNIFEDSETLQISPYDQISREYATNFKVDNIFIFKNENNIFNIIGSSKDNINISFSYDEPIIQKLTELKKDIYIPQGIYKFQPLLEKNEEFISQIEGIYLKPKFEGPKLEYIIAFFLNRGKSYDKDMLLNISNKIAALI